jgi:adenosylmethionine-8-amino-7-oxononanoate aminotransferase
MNETRRWNAAGHHRTALLQQTISASPPVVVGSRGVYLFDSSGRDYIDGSGGAMTVSIGHGVEEVLVAMQLQARQVCFAFRTQFTSEASEELAGVLTRLAPGDLNHVLFANSGSEVTEMAMRAAAQYWRELGKPQKTHVLGRTTSYHGMTLGALSMSGHDIRRRDYGDLLHSFNVGPTPGCWERPSNVRVQEVEDPEDWTPVIESYGAEKIAAIIVEPIIGAAGGVLVPPIGHLQKLRLMCDKLDILLIADEVVTGFGRTGEWFGCQHDYVVPDMIAAGKGMTSGYTPMAALLLCDRIVEAMSEGSNAVPFGHTFSGNPLSAATSLAVLRYMHERKVLENGNTRSPQLANGLRLLAERHRCMANVRGRGMLWGFDLVYPGTDPSLAPDQPNKSVFVADCFEAGLIVYPAGIPPRSAAIISPPLTITEAEVNDLLARLDIGMSRFSARLHV